MPFEEDHKVLPCGCETVGIADVFPYFRFTKHCVIHSKERDTLVSGETAFVEKRPKPKATDADVEKVANYLLKGHVSDAYEISKSLNMEGIIVIKSVRELMRRGTVGVTASHPRKFFFNP